MFHKMSFIVSITLFIFLSTEGKAYQSLLDIEGIQICSGKDRHGEFVYIEYPKPEGVQAAHMIAEETGAVGSIDYVSAQVEVQHIVRDWYFDVPLFFVHFYTYPYNEGIIFGEVFTVNPSDSNSRFVSSPKEPYNTCEEKRGRNKNR